MIFSYSLDGGTRTYRIVVRIVVGSLTRDVEPSRLGARRRWFRRRTHEPRLRYPLPRLRYEPIRLLRLLVFFLLLVRGDVLEDWEPSRCILGGVPSTRPAPATGSGSGLTLGPPVAGNHDVSGGDECPQHALRGCPLVDEPAPRAVRARAVLRERPAHLGLVLWMPQHGPKFIAAVRKLCEKKTYHVMSV